MDEKREQFRAQIRELHRLAEEAESCAQLLRQQAEKHESILEQDGLTEQQLDALLAEKPDRTFDPQNTPAVFRPAEGLM